MQNLEKHINVDVRGEYRSELKNLIKKADNIHNQFLFQL